MTRFPLVAGLFKNTRLRPLFLVNTSTQSQSLRAGLQYVQQHGASHVLLLLGDMPNVPRHHLKKMIAKVGAHPLMSHNGKFSLPPALIPSHLFGKLQHLQGDNGAGKMLMHHPSIIRLPLDDRQALDVDTKIEH